MPSPRRTLLRRMCAGLLLLLACALAVLLGWRLGDRIDDAYGRWAARLAGKPFVSASAQRYFLSTLGAQLRVDEQLPAGTVIFLGDSITQGLAVTGVAPQAVNFGIGQQTTGLMLQALPRYRSLPRSAALVLTIGVNDVLSGEGAVLPERLRQLSQALPAGQPLLWNAVMPLRGQGADRNAALLAANAQARALCAARPGCRFLDTWAVLADAQGEADARWVQADGIHLNLEGYRRWIAALKPALQALLSESPHAAQG